MPSSTELRTSLEGSAGKTAVEPPPYDVGRVRAFVEAYDDYYGDEGHDRDAELERLREEQRALLKRYDARNQEVAQLRERLEACGLERDRYRDHYMANASERARVMGRVMDAEGRAEAFASAAVAVREVHQRRQGLYAALTALFDVLDRHQRERSVNQPS